MAKGFMVDAGRREALWREAARRKPDFVAAASTGRERIVLIGDSTVTDSAGWGRSFANRFGGQVRILDLAAGGRSPKSWCNAADATSACPVMHRADHRVISA